jgi:hypothetical protein
MAVPAAPLELVGGKHGEPMGRVHVEAHAGVVVEAEIRLGN